MGRLNLCKSDFYKFLLIGLIIIFIFTSQSVFAKEKETRGYTYDLKQLIKQAEENIEKAEEKLKQQEIERHNKEREAEIREHFERGQGFYQEGKLEAAKREWEKVLELSQDPEMKNYIRESIKRDQEEGLARKKQEAEKKHQEELVRKEQERQQKEEQRRLERQKREEELARKKEEEEHQKRLEQEQREKECLEKEEKKKLEKQRKKEKGARDKEELERQKEQKRQQEEKKRLEREKQRKLEAERREKETLEQKKQRELERQQREKQRQVEKEREKSERIERDVKEMAKGSEEKPGLSLEDLTYKTAKECLDILEKNAEDKGVFDNLVKLYRLEERYIARGKEFHNKGDYQAAMREWQKALAIEPENKKVIGWMRKGKRKNEEKIQR